MSNEIQNFITQAADGLHLSRVQAGRAFQIIMSGGATPAQIAALLVALRVKGESVSEILGAASAMRAKMDTLSLQHDCMDVCGTGGDGLGMLNVSTAVAIVLAGCGLKVAKHGNKSVSSRSGSADVLAALGVNIQAEKSVAEKSLQQAGLCFLYAPLYHKAMRHVAPVRQELGVRTIFNLLGPLVNPAKPAYQIMGVYDRSLLAPMAQTLHALGSKRAWVACGSDGSDELTLTGVSYVAEWKNGAVHSFVISPEDAGLTRCNEDDLGGASPQYNAKELSLLLAGKKSPYRDMVLLNAAAALVVAQKATTLLEGATVAARAIDEGKAQSALAALVSISNESK
jgi:anthranilate phosphoribosyltransferase